MPVRALSPLPGPWSGYNLTVAGLVVIPTLNEVANLAPLVQAVRHHAPSLHLLIVDDQSPDGTGAVADRLAAHDPQVHVVHRAGRPGYGRACLAGFRWALASDFDPILTMDADFSHDPAVLPDLLLTDAEFDVVIGSRYCNGMRIVNWPRYRIWLSRFANHYARLATGLPVRDCTSGYRCYRRRVLASLDLDAVVSHHYAFLIELVARACWAGWQIGEIPITFTERRQGRSKLSARVLAEAAIVPWRLRFARRRARRTPDQPAAVPMESEITK